MFLCNLRKCIISTYTSTYNCSCSHLLLGDNKESNAYLGFVRAFVANFFCRYCRMQKLETHEALVEIIEKLRNKNNYYEDVLENNVTATGVVEYSILNGIPLFHATDSSAEDITHIVDEGIMHYNLLPSLRYFIYERNYFTLQKLNDRIKFFNYTEDEKKNVPMPISKDFLREKKKRNKEVKKRKTTERKKFKMTASEMFNFAHNLIFMIRDLVPEDDIVWQFVLTTIKFLDLSYLPCYEEDDLNEFKEAIASMHNSYKQLFNQTLKPVHHIAIHFPRDTLNFGPMRNLRTIR